MALKKMHQSEFLTFYSVSTETHLERPFVEGGVKAGFPSPAEDFTELNIDLNLALLKNPEATFFARVNGDSMEDMDIHNGDLLVVDRSRQAADGKVAVCYLDGEFTLKRIKLEKDFCWLMPANTKYKPIKVTSENDFVIWGIVTFVIKEL